MSKVLLLLAEEADPAGTTEAALRRAEQDQAELLVVSLLDSQAPAKMAGRLLDSGTMGARPSADVLDSLRRRNETVAAERARDIVARAEARGITARSEIRRGPFEREVYRLASQWRPDIVVVEKRRRRFPRLSREEAVLGTLERNLGFELIEP